MRKMVLPLASEDQKCIKNNIRVCLSTRKCFAKVSPPPSQFYFKTFLVSWSSFSDLLWLVRWSQRIQTQSTAGGPAGNWTAVRSQLRWCVATSMDSCSFSQSCTPNWELRAWASHHIWTFLVMQPAKPLGSDVRRSSPVLSRSKPSWAETVRPEVLLCAACRSSEQSSNTDWLRWRGPSAAALSLRGLFFTLHRDVSAFGQQGAADS